MFDARIRPLIDPALNRMGEALAGFGISANQVSLAGAVFGAGAGVAIANRYYDVGLGLILASRLLDGLDGAIARATRPTDFGGYLDIVCDYIFYIATPLGFALAETTNRPASLLLLASFTLTAVSFLAFASIAAKRRLETTTHGRKSFFYSTGLAEGAETILAFVVMCLWPAGFPAIAVVFSALCLATVAQRTARAFHDFHDNA